MFFLSLYGFPLSSGFFLLVYICVFPLGLHLCLSFGYIILLCAFGFAFTVKRKRRGVLRPKGQGGVMAGISVSHHLRNSV
jgi:hypothetical protein